jgi:hypothetical protein
MSILCPRNPVFSSVGSSVSDAARFGDELEGEVDCEFDLGRFSLEGWDANDEYGL